MIIMPAIDIYEGKVVRLFKGDYNEMTVYSEDPVAYAKEFKKLGATHLHIVDLEGAKTGETPNIDIIAEIAKDDDIFTEVGGGIRNMTTIDKYIEAGVDRIILGTAAVTDEGFLKAALAKYGDKIAVSVDMYDGNVAIKGWTLKTDLDSYTFCDRMRDLGVKTIVATDISRDGTLNGISVDLFKEMQMWFDYDLDIIGGGGVSSLDDIKLLKILNLPAVIVGKAYYEGKIDLAEAIKIAK